MTTPQRVNLFDFSTAALQHWLAEQCGQASYRARQIIQWLHQQGVTDVNQMTNLSRSLREQLSQQTVVELPKIINEQIAADGTIKWLLSLAEGNAIETVFIPEPNRGTLCISSQVGCALNCSFCATGKQGFNRNLSLSEIIGQVWLAKQRLAEHKGGEITNIVFMGMGEPLLNYANVVAALELLLSDYAYGLSKYRVTVSTAGVVPAMYRLHQDSLASLAVSLHAANDPLRDQLVPLNKKYPLKLLMQACRDHFPSGSKRSVTFEYVLLADVNDSLQDADALITQVKGISCKINLIPFNSFEGSVYRRPADAVIKQFQRCLLRAGLKVWLRRTRGDEIDGACGQLAGKFQDRTGRHQRWIQKGSLVPVGNHRLDAAKNAVL